MASLVSFDAIEAQKENIEPCRDGRSALALSKVFANEIVAQTDALQAKQDAFERELLESIDLDDPLEVWCKYIAWTKEAYPSGHNASSGYIQLLERCSKQFIRTQHYANDPRYLKIWIEYARYSDDPRELFCFLARNEIGQDLATFYEEYAAFLEVHNRKNQADEIYQMGILRNARPVNRLRRKYGEFSKRLAASPADANEPSSPPIAAVRPALIQKLGGLANGDAAPKPLGLKMQIFQDEGESSHHVGTEGWTSIGTLKSRRKENTIETRKMFGEKMSQTDVPQAAARLEIFKDEPTLKPVVELKKNERVACNLEAIYAHPGEEYCFEELKARAMGLLDFLWTDVQPAKQDTYVSVMDTESPLKSSPKERLKRQMASPTINTKAAMDDILGIFSQPLKCEHSDSSESDSEDEPDNTFPVSQETWTKQFDDPTSDQIPSTSIDDEPQLPSFETPNSDDLVQPIVPVIPATPQPILPRTGGFNMMTPITEDNESLLSVKKPAQLTIYEEEEGAEPYSSPFIENPPQRPTTSMLPPKKPILAEKLKERATEHKISIPTAPVKGPLIQDTICNPMDASIRQTIFATMFPQLTSYENCQVLPHESYGKKFEAIEKYIRALNKKGGEVTQHLEVILDFSSRFTIKKKLGEGAFAPVFLLENISGVKNDRSKYEAVKIEKPGNAWEFHIMRTIARRLGVHRACQSIAKAHEYHEFSDCSFLIIDYACQGTLLDLINASRSDAGGVDEQLAIFLTVELLRTVEQLHAKGIMHGDLKADNCLLRFNSISDSDWSSQYHADGSHGWQDKGLKLIDFGRGIDMRNFKPNVQFIADWETDAQDCAEMREMRPWTWQIDYHGIACIAHSLLFGKYIETQFTKTIQRHYSLKTPFKRYWKTELWDPLFEVLLNPPSSFEPTTLSHCRMAMEAHLTETSTHGIGLKALIKKIELR